MEIIKTDPDIRDMSKEQLLDVLAKHLYFSHALSTVIECHEKSPDATFSYLEHMKRVSIRKKLPEDEPVVVQAGIDPDPEEVEVLFEFTDRGIEYIPNVIYSLGKEVE